ncbi:LysE family translocator [Nitratireductor sp. ZSWI3]|uniref:LysE family translocator n=1 Tax=Nitratireductor sp. ZSWI3 TaxID=2966359 RepID=UPI00214F7C6A|nr:LysE family translocator [Nitratireductor sp. ZSWI3]MCR4267708.1 LysE family translocator [Nitratireductor sp. ZSWI3]
MFDVYLPGLLLAWSAYGLGILSPGPNVLAVMGTSMEHGRRPGVTLAAGMVSGTLVWGTATLMGLTALLAVYASALTLIKFAGAAYLLWLAYKSFRAALSSQSDIPRGLEDYQKAKHLYLRGLIIQLSNPKAALTWIAIMSLAVREGSPLWVGPAVVAGCLVISFGGHMIYALLFSAPPVGRVYLRARRWIQGGLGAFFCFASWKLASARF